jgi:hypothetical protein
MSDKDFPLPPPSFEFLVLSLRMQVETHLGLNPFVEEQQEPTSASPAIASTFCPC